MGCIGIDYSASTIYLGVVSFQKEVKHNEDISLEDDLGWFINRLTDQLRISRHQFGALRHIWLEKPWVSSSINQYTGLQLMRMATIIEVVGSIEGFQINFVGSMSWRKTIYGSAKVPDKKEAARTYAANEFGFETKFKNQHNICEALILSHYGNLQLEKLIVK